MKMLIDKDSSGNWNRQSWKDFYNLTESISKSLLACNIDKNKVSIYSYNRIEWSHAMLQSNRSMLYQ